MHTIRSLLGPRLLPRKANPWRTWTVFLAAALLAAALGTPALAEVRILASPGGEVGPFLDLFERIGASGQRVVVDGPCLSACTLVLTVVPAGLFLLVKSPVKMVVAGGIAQSLLLPALGAAALYRRHRHLPREVAPSSFVTAALWLATALMLGLMAYAVVLTLRR